MATNWILIERGAERLTDGDQRTERDEFVRHISQRLTCSSDEADELLVDKEAQVESTLYSLQLAHTRISGKHLLDRIYRSIMVQKKGLLKDHLRRLLRDRVMQTDGVHHDLREIVEAKVLRRVAL